ncbi:MAG TPA: DUF551 domain-containing protein [Hanamia sp.]|jgi:Protein of unknown function (DUF551).|nr:DUF551 domain-containing protein [Hanamia sp.]
MNKWISVKDKLPHTHDYVLAYLSILYGECKVCFYHCGNFYANNVDDEILTQYVTHWMSLPQPPEEKAD